MSYPLIILGAGASYDYIRKESEEPSKFYGKKPPLTNQLFNPKFSEIINRHRLGDLPATVASRLSKQSFEEILRDLKERFDKNPERKQELIALQFYLQDLFNEVLGSYGDQAMNNYKALIGCIKDSSGQACVVNFNYDLLFEEAMGIHKEYDVKTYISKPIKVIKIHGASNWRYAIQLNQLMDPNDISSSREFLFKNPDYLDNFKPQNIIVSDSYVSSGVIKKHLMPAIAIPLPSKTNFICPQNHIDELTESIKKADKVLIIGWKANDNYVLDLIDEHAKDKLPTTIVSGTDSIETIKKSINLRSKLYVAAEHIGFSDFVGSVACDTFFAINKGEQN